MATKEIEVREAQCQQLLQKMSAVEHALEVTKAESEIRNDQYVYYNPLRMSVIFIYPGSTKPVPAAR